jgi:hypothetical protein
VPVRGAGVQDEHEVVFARTIRQHGCGLAVEDAELVFRQRQLAAPFGDLGGDRIGCGASSLSAKDCSFTCAQVSRFVSLMVLTSSRSGPGAGDSIGPVRAR